MKPIPPDPSLKDLQLYWESKYWGKRSWNMMARFYEDFMKYFGEARKPRDIFRSDVVEYKHWLEKKGWSERSIESSCERWRRFYRWLDERELIEKDWNPF
jgi:site-specific recombinase XerD